MPPRAKDRGASEKASAARERKATVEAEKKHQAAMEAEDSKWADEGSTAKERRAREKAKKEEERTALADKKKQLLAEDEASVSKPTVKPRKVTMYDLRVQKEANKVAIQKKVEQQEHERQKIFTDDPLEITNVNHEVADAMRQDILKYGSENVHVAYDVDAALQALSFHHKPVDLSTTSAKMEDKKRKFAFKKFEADRMPELKADHPDLKLSQLKDKLFKEWERSSENPKNQH